MAIGSQVLYTAEEFGRRPDPGYPEELVRGRIVTMPPPGSRHGKVCYNVAYRMGRFLEDHDLGHVLTNDSGVITERGPDTVRGADISFYSYERVPKGPLPPGYLDVTPDLVFEVLSPEDRCARSWEGRLSTCTQGSRSLSSSTRSVARSISSRATSRPAS